MQWNDFLSKSINVNLKIIPDYLKDSQISCVVQMCCNSHLFIVLCTVRFGRKCKVVFNKIY